MNAAFFLQYNMPVGVSATAAAVKQVETPTAIAVGGGVAPASIPTLTPHSDAKTVQKMAACKAARTAALTKAAAEHDKKHTSSIIVKSAVAAAATSKPAESKSGAGAGAGAGVPTIQFVTLVYGNIQPSALMVAQQTMNFLVGKPLSGDTLTAALKILDAECTPGMWCGVGGMREAVIFVCCYFLFFKFICFFFSSFFKYFFLSNFLLLWWCQALTRLTRRG